MHAFKKAATRTNTRLLLKQILTAVLIFDPTCGKSLVMSLDFALTDTHAHLDYADYGADLPEVLSRAHDAGIHRIITIGTGLERSRDAVRLAGEHPSIWATVGFHPEEVKHFHPNHLAELRALAQHPRVVAIGEIGLDYHYLPENAQQATEIKKHQAEALRMQLSLAVELGLNVVLHQRDAWEDTLAILDEFLGKLRAVFHCFGGTIEQAQQILNRGHLISFTGIVTFKNAATVQTTAREIPLDQFMIETDCPYLAPTPHRGKRCEPAHARIVAEKIAELRRTPIEEIARATEATANAFFKRIAP